MTDYIYHQELRVRIIRSTRRKSLALTVKSGEASVRMPQRLGLDHAETFIAQKADWLRNKLAEYPNIETKRYINEEVFLYLGQPLTLNIFFEQKQNHIAINSQTLQVSTGASSFDELAIKKQLIRWYRQQADHFLKERTEKISQRTKLHPTSVQIRQYKARWGSCKLTGAIQLNWALIMAPIKVIDYVIIHELCHLKQHNHSPAFWALVENFEPDYKVLREWLKIHGQTLRLD
jgi:hypothetical protein